MELGHEGRMQWTICASKVVFSLGGWSRGRFVNERGVTAETFGCSVALGSQHSNESSRSGGGSGSVQLW